MSYHYREPTKLTNQVALYCNLVLVQSTVRVLLLHYVAFIHYIQHLLTHAVDILITDGV